MKEKDNIIFNERVEKITKELNDAVPKGSKAYEVVYALCILLAHIFINQREENVDKEEYVFALKEIISDLIDVEENN